MQQETGISPQVIVERFMAAWNRMDMEGVYAMMAPDIVWDNVPLGATTGVEAARASMTAMPPHEGIEFLVHRIAVNGRVVLTERTDRFLVAGRWREIHLMGLFEINERGLIQVWRDYFDLGEFTRAFA